MSAVDKFRQEKSSFLLLFFLYTTVSFLAVSILFGIYICKSFNSQVYMTQDANGDYNTQEMNR